jgi:hypothetical protein
MSFFISQKGKNAVFTGEKKRSPDRNRGRLPKLTAYEKKFILNL